MKQGEVWLVNLDPTLGAEMRKTRPAVIISSDGLGKLPLKIIAPVTDWKDHYEKAPWMVKLVHNASNGLSKDSAVDCFQVRSVSTVRLTKRLGQITDNQLKSVQEAVAEVIGA